MQEILLASGNPGKIQEITTTLSTLPVKLTTAKQHAIGDIEETASTFVENALIKARHAAQITGLPTIADDSGLAVNALAGRPGIFSARWAGPQATDHDRINKLLTELVNTPKHQRQATFYCVTVLLRHADDPAPIICQGSWQGEILTEPRGHNGFGYDPIFYVPQEQCSAAELDPTTKNKISHRGQALIKLHHAISTFLHQGE